MKTARKVVLLFAMAALAANGQSNACDLVAPLGVDASDVQAVVNMFLGILSPCTANINGSGVCNAVTVQRVVNVLLGGQCITGTTRPHSVTLSWVASTSVVAGYDAYRSATSGGPYTKISSGLVVGTSYVDMAVSAGQTYYYVVTAVDSSNNSSVYSNEAQAVVPSP